MASSADVPPLTESFVSEIENSLLRWSTASGQSPMFNAKLEVIDRPEFVASIRLVDVEASGFCLVFSTGAASMLAKAVATACACENVLPHLGDVSRFDASTDTEWPFCRIFRDELRQRLAHQLFEMAVKFIVLHEQGHFVSGHLHQLVDATGHNNASFTELVTAKLHASGAQDYSDRQRMEMQADTVASQLLLNTEAVSVPKDARVWFDNAGDKDWLPVATTAIGCVCALLEVLAKRQGIGIRSHPSAGARLLNVLRYVYTARADRIRSGVGKTIETRFSGKNDPWHDVRATLVAIGAAPLTDEDLAHFFSAPEKTPPTVTHAYEAYRLLAGVGDLRQTLAPHSAKALLLLQTPANAPPASVLIDDAARAGASAGTIEAMKHAFGDLSVAQFQNIAIAAVAASGRHVPWSLLGRPEFYPECYERGLPVLKQWYPDPRLWPPSK